MRKGLGLLFAVSLFIPVGIWAAAPAGSAVKGPTCTTFSAKGTYAPPLPKIGVATLINSVNKSTATLGGCTGGGVTGATIVSSFKYKGNCSTFAGLSKGGVVSSPSTKFTWSNGKTSSALVTTKALSKPGVQPAVIQLTTKITSGLFAGTTSVGKALGTAAKGACISTTLGAFTLKGTGTTTFK
ncbi:MAG TPA: hypothetical protein VK771_05285 [Acidimicrobiia bacterium]|nr:hypothetical protein [Acidimicrobiia bacterium]